MSYRSSVVRTRYRHGTRSRTQELPSPSTAVALVVAVPVQRAVSRSCSENLVSTYIDRSEDNRTVWHRVVVRLCFPLSGTFLPDICRSALKKHDA
ncbi:hypothetical protein P692DRAFT_20117787 [Suillus brevipes Sb2]|nr:hypothetical protein P692DRAFT_20117787 [Suillus brevipes Sb2]